MAIQNLTKQKKMRKSLAVNFNAYSAVDDEYSSSGSYGESDTELSNENFSFSTGRTESQEFTVDLSPMFMQHGIPAELVKNEPFALDIDENEYSFEQLNSTTTPTIPFRVEPIECVIINVAHLEQFPKPSSQYSAKLPSIYAWFDAQTAFPSEYIPTVQLYFKTYYNKIRAHLRFFFSIAPSNERMHNLSSVRREVPAGRILFHYIGHGFPTITEKNIWSSEKRSTNFQPFDLGQLFSRLKPPTWFIFDCSNAAAVIPTFLETAKKQPNISGVDWNDWFCICATDVGEELPSDPRIPRDFLTSCVLSSVRMAVVCHILQHYRVSLVSGKFPLDQSSHYLLSDKSPEVKKLSLALTAITDAIAADSLSPDLYHKIFRCDRLSAVLFRHFLLAQFLLRPYKVHPKSHPALPDLSMHKLWHHWSIMIDTAICAVQPPRPSFASELFTRLAITFQQILRNNQLQLVRPYHLSILFHMLFTDPTNDKPLFLLAEYASNPKPNPQMLVSATVFHCLIQKVMSNEVKNSAFHSLCYLILALLYYHPAFATEIRKELDVTNFPPLIFNTELNEETRILVVALLADLVITNESFQQICTSYDFLTGIRKELGTAKPRRALWLLILIRRSFHLFSPESNDFICNGLHVQCASFIFHKASSCRAAAVSAITCFLRPFECDLNGQLLFMVLPTVFDASYLVRFHLLLLLKKFVVSFDCCSDSINVPEPSFPADTFGSMMSAFYRCKTFSKDNFFNEIDDVVHSDKFIKHAYSVALFVIKLFTNDPHLSVSTLATRILSFVKKQHDQFVENMKLKEKQRNNKKGFKAMRTVSSTNINAAANAANAADLSSSKSITEFKFGTGNSGFGTGGIGIGRNLRYGSSANFAATFGNKVGFGNSSGRWTTDEDDCEHNVLTNLDQNESLHQIALRNLIKRQKWKLDDSQAFQPFLEDKLSPFPSPISIKMVAQPFRSSSDHNKDNNSIYNRSHNNASNNSNPNNSSKNNNNFQKRHMSCSVIRASIPVNIPSSNKSNEPTTISIAPAQPSLSLTNFQMISILNLKIDSNGKRNKAIKAAFHKNSIGIAAATNNTVYYFDGQNKSCSIKCNGVSDIKVADWGRKGQSSVNVIIASTTGNIFIWRPPRTYFTSSFRSSMGTKTIVAVSPEIPFIIYTGDEKGIITKWDILSFSMVGEWKCNTKSQITSLVFIPSRLQQRNLFPQKKDDQTKGQNKEIGLLQPQSLVIQKSPNAAASVRDRSVSFNMTEQQSSNASSPETEEVCIVGFANGAIERYRLEKSNKENVITVLDSAVLKGGLEEEDNECESPISKIVISELKNGTFFAMNDEGKCVSWNGKFDTMQPIQYILDVINSSSNGNISDFSQPKQTTEKTENQDGSQPANLTLSTKSSTTSKVGDSVSFLSPECCLNNQNNDNVSDDAINEDKKTPFIDFDSHPIFPVLLFSQTDHHPYLTKSDGKILYRFRAADRNACIAVHPTLPIFALGSTSGRGESELVLYHLKQNENEKEAK